MATRVKKPSTSSSSPELVSSLVLHPKRARTSNIDAIAESIGAHGFLGGVIAQTSTRYVLVGNGRVEGAALRKIEEVPVFWIDCSDVEAEKILLVDNRLSDLATYDDAALISLLSDVQAKVGLSGTGYDDEAFGLLVEAFQQAERVNQVNGDGTEWVGMPTFEQYEKSFQLILHCETEEMRESLEAELAKHFTFLFSGKGRARYSWYPARERVLLAGAELEIQDESKVPDLHSEQKPV